MKIIEIMLFIYLFDKIVASYKKKSNGEKENNIFFHFKTPHH